MRYSSSSSHAAALSLAVAAALVSSCGSARRSEPITGPMQMESGREVRGQRMFMQHCYACHINGDGGLGPPLNDKPLPEFAIELQIRNGLGAMPAFSEKELDDKALEDVVEYVQALRRER